MTRLLHLRANGVSLVLDGSDGGLPQVAHWGTDLGTLDDDALRGLAASAAPLRVRAGPDSPVVSRVVPLLCDGWEGLPGLRGHRAGRDWSPKFSVHGWDAVSVAGSGGSLEVAASDEAAGLRLELVIRLEPTGLVRMRATVHNDDPVRAYQLEGLVLTLPIPVEAGELLDLTGRWSRERSPQRRDFAIGRVVCDVQRGRTGHDATLLLSAGTPGFGFRTGEVWSVHVAWSGNHRTYSERLPSGQAVLGGGELLLPGEVSVEPGGHYTTPWVYGSHGHGLDAMSARIHDWLRSRPSHPRGPRPVVLNTWEATYFDHDLDRLTALADAAAEVGVERFVLDDGWFRGRRHDRAGLGDWYVDDQVWPQGLRPLIEHVHARGMDFGIWVEPEMVNLDSDLAREHPDWVMAVGSRLPVEFRHQQVLDLGHPGAWDHVAERMDALLTEYPIAFLKWDHNRDLIEAGHLPTGAPGVHAQTIAFYRLLDHLRERHPTVEIESCASGGARIDLEVLSRTDRVWTSDCNDALERQQIQRWTGLLVPPEMMGAHVGPPTSHTTGRYHPLAFRAGTAFFGHLGFEWNLVEADAPARRAAAAWVAQYKRLRPLLHSGRVVRGDHPDPAVWVHGVVADDASSAVYSVVSTQTSVYASPGRLRLPGLDPARRYRVHPLPPGDAPISGGPQAVQEWPAAWVVADATLTGAVLGASGLQMPALWPEQLLLLEVVAL